MGEANQLFIELMSIIDSGQCGHNVDTMWPMWTQCGHILANVDIMWTRGQKCGQNNKTDKCNHKNLKNNFFLRYMMTM